VLLILQYRFAVFGSYVLDYLVSRGSIALFENPPGEAPVRPLDCVSSVPFAHADAGSFNLCLTSLFVPPFPPFPHTITTYLPTNLRFLTTVSYTKNTPDCTYRDYTYLTQHPSWSQSLMPSM